MLCLTCSRLCNILVLCDLCDILVLCLTRVRLCNILVLCVTQMGASSHDVVKVPFQLPPQTANECQFVFYVQSFLVPQKLRGTTTYMVKVGSVVCLTVCNPVLHEIMHF